MIGLSTAILLAVCLLISAGAIGVSLPRVAGPSAAVVEAAATGSQPRNLTFYMHNATVSQNVNGVSTPFLFDTLQKFGQNNTVSKVQSVRQDWRLYPVLAGPLALNGTATMHVFASIDQVGAQITPTLDMSEINAAGIAAWSYTLTSGAQTWWNTPHDLVLTTPAMQHTFAAGSTIEIIVTITSGVRTATLWYNASWVPTHLVLQSDDFARVHDLSFLDSTGAPRLNFDPQAANKTIRIQANVTDPLGGYDIHWVNLTLVQPGGAVLFDSEPMASVSGTPISFASLFQVTWNYTGAPTGRYNATAGVVDQSGFYSFEATYTTAGFLDTRIAFFYIGGLPVFVNVQAVDSRATALAGASISLSSGGVTVESESSDASGLANFTMAKGTYTFTVYWQDVLVASRVYDASANVSAGNPFVITTSVYDPVFQAQDANAAPLADASILFLHPNGSELGPYKTDATGEVTLTQVPVGTYGLEVSWRGVDVFTGSEVVSSNSVITFETAVYELTVTAKSGTGQALAGAFISATDSTGLVFDAGVTGVDGSVVLRLPTGNYTIEARYITEQLGTLYDSGMRSQNLSLTRSTSATVTFSDFPLAITSTLGFLFGVLYAVTIVALLVAFLFLRRRGKPAPPTEVPEKKE